MKGLVHVCLGHPYVIFEAARNGLPKRVNHTQGLITLANGFQDDAKRYDVINVLQIQVLGDHLLVYAKDVLGPAVHFPLQPEIRQLFLDDTLDFLDVTLALLLIPSQATNNLLIHIRIKIGKGKVLQLGPDPVNTEPASKWRVDVQSLLSNKPLFFRGLKIEGAHVVKPVGEFNQDHPDVTGHRQNHLAHVLSLALFETAKLKSADFGYAVNYLANFIPE